MCVCARALFFHCQDRLVELSDIDTFLTYEVISAKDSLLVAGAVHTIRLRRISNNNTTFVEWITVYDIPFEHIFDLGVGIRCALNSCVQDFSVDATVAVIEDSRFKKLDAFSDLACAMRAAGSASASSCLLASATLNSAEIFEME